MNDLFFGVILLIIFFLIFFFNQNLNFLFNISKIVFSYLP